MTERLFEPTDTDDRRAWQRSVRGLPNPAINTVGASHFKDGDETEAAAARLIAPRTGTLRADILQELLRAGDVGRTAWDLSVTFGDRTYSVPPRLPELYVMGWIVAAPFTRATPSGAQATVWVLSERGRESFEGATGS